MIDRLARRLGRVDTRDLVAWGTLLVLLANTPRTPDAVPLLLVLFLATVAPLPIATRFRRSPWPWLALAIGWFPFLLEDWWRHEDHELLGLEHCVALALVLTASRPRAALRLYARAMIVAIFVCALAWKLTAPSFLTGETFAWAVAHDPRFADRVLPEDRDDVGEARIVRDRPRERLAGEEARRAQLPGQGAHEDGDDHGACVQAERGARA